MHNDPLKSSRSSLRSLKVFNILLAIVNSFWIYQSFGSINSFKLVSIYWVFWPKLKLTKRPAVLAGRSLGYPHFLGKCTGLIDFDARKLMHSYKYRGEIKIFVLLTAEYHIHEAIILSQVKNVNVCSL